MDICNFAKVIIARASKDNEAIKWWIETNFGINKNPTNSEHLESLMKTNTETITTNEEQTEIITNNEEQTETLTNYEEQTETIINKEEQTETLTNYKEQTETIINNEEQTETITNNEEQTETISNNEEQTEKLTNNEGQTETITNNKEQTETTSNNEEQTETITNYMYEEQTETTSNNEEQTEKITNNEGQTETITNNEEQTETITNNEGETITNNEGQTKTITNNEEQTETITNNEEQTETITNNEETENKETNDNPGKSKKKKRATKKKDVPTVYTSNLTMPHRYDNYMMLTENYPKLHMDYSVFKRKTTQLQKYLSEKKYWRNNSKSDERLQFLNYFSLQSWNQLSQQEKVKHTLHNCVPCKTIHLASSSLHKSLDDQSCEVIQTCKKAAEHLIETVSPTSRTEEKGVKVIKAIVNIIQPIIEENINTKFKGNLADSLSPTAISAKTHKKELKKTVHDSKQKIQDVMSNEKTDVTNFLSSRKSYRKYQTDRMAGFFESFESAEARNEKQIEAETSGKKKPKQHHGNLKNYSFELEGFLQELRDTPEGSDVIWKSMARKYNLKINDHFPDNGGQVAMEFARQNQIDPNLYNKSKRMSSRDYNRRVRRAKNIIILADKNIKHTIPTPRNSKAINKDIKEQLRTGELYIGEKIVEKTKLTEVINTDGEFVEKSVTVHARKLPLTYIREQSLKEQLQQGLLRYRTDEEYQMMEKQTINETLTHLGLSPPDIEEEARQLLKTTERTRKIKIWHDHSDILNHSYICFTISFLYDEANFYTDEEYQQRKPTKNRVKSIQAIVEKPKLYIFGQSGSSDEEQTLFTSTRIEDLVKITEPTKTTYNNREIIINDVLRVFSGDGPARQFESGQQRGGHYSCLCGVFAQQHDNIQLCYSIQPITLDERRQLSISSYSIKRMRRGIINPFSDLLKFQLIKELKARNIKDLDDLTKPQLQKILTEMLHGITRPPALMLPNPELNSLELNIPHYEILSTEPLHDLTNLITNISKELPIHIKDKETQKELQTFWQQHIGEKHQVKGSDARLYLVKLAKLAETLHAQKKIDQNTYILIESLSEITNISYSKYETRTPKQILRLYNQCFLFAVTCTTLIDTPCKIKKRRFFGSHFHSVTIHLPETLRLFNLRSIVTEQEERIFGDLRRISEDTSNRQAQYVVDNAVLHFNGEQASKLDSLATQESTIHIQARGLSTRKNSLIPSNIVKRQRLLQTHLERIADFLLPGQDIWWHIDDNGNMIFLDGPDEPGYHPEGPPLSHFRSSSLKKENDKLKKTWKAVTAKFEDNELNLPLRTIKAYKDDGKPYFVHRKTVKDSESNASTIDYIPDLPVNFEASSNAQITEAAPIEKNNIISVQEKTLKISDLYDDPQNTGKEVKKHAETSLEDDHTPDHVKSRKSANENEKHDMTEILTCRPENDGALDLTTLVSNEPCEATRNENEEVKKKYRSFTKVTKWCQKIGVQNNPYPIDVDVIVLAKPQDTHQKRKLEETETLRLTIFDDKQPHSTTELGQTEKDGFDTELGFDYHENEKKLKLDLKKTTFLEETENHSLASTRTATRRKLCKRNLFCSNMSKENLSDDLQFIPIQKLPKFSRTLKPKDDNIKSLPLAKLPTFDKREYVKQYVQEPVKYKAARNITRPENEMDLCKELLGHDDKDLKRVLELDILCDKHPKSQSFKTQLANAKAKLEIAVSRARTSLKKKFLSGQTDKETNKKIKVAEILMKKWKLPII